MKKLLTLFLLFSLTAGWLQADELRDTIRQVKVHVVAKEKDIPNYDSIFRAQSTVAKNASAPKTSPERKDENVNEIIPDTGITGAPALAAAYPAPVSLPENVSNMTTSYESVSAPPITFNRTEGAHTSNFESSKASFMHVGIVIFLIGIVLGLVFGRIAFLLSGSGVVFMLIAQFLL